MADRCTSWPTPSSAAIRAIRAAPLAWVRVSKDDETLRPVYPGDVLWHEVAGKVIASAPHPHGSNGFSFTKADFTESWGVAGCMVWTPPKVKSEVRLLGWFNGSTLLRRVEGYSEPTHWRRVPSEDKTIEVEAPAGQEGGA